MTSNELSNTNGSVKWAVIYITHDITEAHIVAERLKSENIMAILDHMPGMSAIGITLGSFGEVRVLVHPAEYDRAYAILFPDELDELPDSIDDIAYYWDDDDDDE